VSPQGDECDQKGHEKKENGIHNREQPGRFKWQSRVARQDEKKYEEKNQESGKWQDGGKTLEKTGFSIQVLNPFTCI
jgi:hypothetical protein